MLQEGLMSGSNSQLTSESVIRGLLRDVQLLKERLRDSDAAGTEAYNLVEKDVDRICDRLDEDSNSTQSILQLLANIQEHCSQVQRAAATTCSLSQQVVQHFDTLVSVCGELERRLQVVEGERDAAQQQTKKLQQELEFLSLLRDHIAVFRKNICSKLSYRFDTWEELAVELAIERGLKARNLTAPTPVTQDLDSVLARCGIVWSDWESIPVVADASNHKFHTGFLMGPEDTIKAIDSGSLAIPSAFQTTVTPLKKMLQYNQYNRRLIRRF